MANVVLCSYACGSYRIRHSWLEYKLDNCGFVQHAITRFIFNLCMLVWGWIIYDVNDVNMHGGACSVIDLLFGDVILVQF